MNGSSHELFDRNRVTSNHLSGLRAHCFFFTDQHKLHITHGKELQRVPQLYRSSSSEQSASLISNLNRASKQVVSLALL